MEKPPQFPDSFWNGMSPFLKAEVIKLESAGHLLLPTGSRVICPEDASGESDWDVYFYNEKRSDAQDMMLNQWKSPGRINNDEYWPDSISLKKRLMCGGELNLIVFFDRNKFGQFHEATQFCVGLGGPRDKQKRIALFKKFLALVPSEVPF